MAEIDSTEQEAMAAEWAAAAGGAGGDEGGDDMAAAMGMPEGSGDDLFDTDTGRILNQNEIDSLLGFDDGSGSGGMSGIHAIVNSSMVSYERLPMLEVVFDRLVRMLSTSLRNFTSDNVEVSLDNITSIRFGDYLNSIPLPALLAVYKAEEWDNYGLLTVDSALIYSVVDVLLGGRRGGTTMRVEGRPFTTIERNLIERMINLMMNDVSTAFDPVSPVTFHFERLETNPRFAAIARPANAAVLVKLRIDMEDRGGKMEFCLPYATLEPVREILLQMFMGEKFGRDSIWENHLASELWMTDVDIHAVLGESVIPLNDVLHWKPGTRLEFITTPDSSVDIRCGDVPLFAGKMGQRNQKIAIKVDQRLIKVT
ncbi:MAG: flagellar motor switch protein FliM [Holosporales bacterium]|jgi:flagellar motor switch protein FliM